MTRLFGRRRWRCARRARAGFTFIDLLVSILCLACATQGFLGCRTRSSGCSTRVKCASNLRQIGQAILLYSNDNRGAYPRTRATHPAGGLPVWGTRPAATQPFKDDGPEENDVTAAMFMLLRTQDITSEVFTCPTSNGEKDLFEGQPPNLRSNFADVKKNLTYSFQNPYPTVSAIGKGFKFNNTLGAEFAVAADINPGTAGDGDDVLKPKVDSSAKEMRFGNSNNHDKDGQNILYGDGHVAWESNPFVGVERDHIFTTADGKVVGSSVDANDSILLPADD